MGNPTKRLAALLTALLLLLFAGFSLGCGPGEEGGGGGGNQETPVDPDPGPSPGPDPTPPPEEEYPDYGPCTETRLIRVKDCPTDFMLEVPAGRAVKILQISDPQLMDMSSMEAVVEREWDENFRRQFESWEDNCYRYIRQVVRRTQPDLILIAGDIVYGEFDDWSSDREDGEKTMLQDLVRFFESLNVYWAPVFGNHDTSAASDKWGDPVPKDLDWICRQYEEAEHCLFVRNEALGGNGNYSIAVKQGEKIVRDIYMLDTKGSMDSQGNRVNYGMTEVQLKWFEETAARVDGYAGEKVGSFACFHVPLGMFAEAAEKYGYTGSNRTDIVIGENTDGDSGHMAVGLTSADMIDPNHTAYARFKAGGVEGFFCGHIHQNNTSILYDGVRFTFGVKSSIYAGYNAGELGGTLITLDGREFTVTQELYQSGEAAA